TNYGALIHKQITLARAAKSPAGQDKHLNKARSDVALAQLNGATQAKVLAWNATIASTSDDLHHITREASTVVLADFSKFPSARPTELAASPGLIYILDPGRKSVFSVTAPTTSNPSQVLTAGESDSGFTIGTP